MQQIRNQSISFATYLLFSVRVLVRMLQPLHKLENFIVTTSTLAQVVGFAQKPFWSSFVKICQNLGAAH